MFSVYIFFFLHDNLKIVKSDISCDTESDAFDAKKTSTRKTGRLLQNEQIKKLCFPA